MNIPKVFKNPRYLVLFFGMTISKLGMWFFTIALPLIVYDLTQSASKMALVFAIEITPQVLFSLIGGALADQVSKKKIMVFGDYTSALIVLIVPLMFWMEYSSLFVIYAVAFALASLAAFHHPSFESAVPEVLPHEDLIQGNSYFRLSENIITFIGPAVAGFMIAIFGNVNVLLVTGATFFCAGTIFIFLKLPSPSQNVGKFPKLLKPIKEGLNYVFRTKIILAGSLVIFGINIGFGAVESLFMFFLRDYIQFTSAQIGMVFSLQAIGPVIAVYLAGRLKHIPRGNIIVFSGILIGIAQILLIFSQSYVIALIVCQILIKGSVTLLAINWFTLRQELVPSDLLGRVISSTRMAAFLALPISAMIAGFLADFISVIPIFITAGTIAIVCSLIGMKTSLFVKNGQKTLNGKVDIHQN
ncbi:MFS transporter [Alteribacillus bidgolensis]|uniref:Sugar phosphate permease n=1 Tax=Alteribacillus bidgolensis TaxID=930129 RepID=A0A1G8QPF6_9BACI|nr:MFS transporter [Alteribacillus bidgolensis]SDJ06557.1 Sugar phosphate permease [Alteribacillus bidgolensis]